MKLRMPVILMLASVIAVSGCASIVSGRYQVINIKSNPDDATVKVYDSKGEQISNSKTPFIITLKKGKGYFKSAKYRLVIEKAGYSAAEVQITSRIGGWYAFGNLLFGGLIGYLIVDPLTGAMWTLSPEEVNATLGSETTSLNDKEGLIIVLKEAVPPELLGKMKPVQN
jgi:hypothetical protein